MDGNRKWNYSLFVGLLCGVSSFAAPLHAQIIKTKTTTYTYDFPWQSSPTSQKSKTITSSTNCYVSSGNGGSGNSGGNSEGWGMGGGGSNGSSSSDSVASGGDTWGGAASTDSGSGNGGKVICTYFYQKGTLDEIIYFADIEGSKVISDPITVRGYHAWGIWYAKHLRSNPGGFMEKIIWPVVKHRSHEIAFQLGVVDEPDYLGKFFRLLLEPFCYVLGLCVKEQNWRSLYTADDFNNFALGYRRYKAYKAFRAAQHELTPLQTVIRLDWTASWKPGYPAPVRIQ